ncbi:GNAT family N-acetyltransferase [Oculatella sp. FACHB-28]|uniref:GNAT family N-acetyltransferase n=1 Tax=Cyanophyceae TaxID=3028117 RepID=UPI00168A0C83|nr:MULTISPECIES: GNAT family N-acetyltransferase [Cyanophyceae]MBD1997873.1 GNAT family N-acetyltransferase [Leptolyngbya sp. FACHB-541]MBD2059708.1 GNAT family N-acetyltransferase [Oculatella sp. FACHB-28]MBD2067726.1 GNAT family N-acetyltransferase [Leptolyngbya sp. FACHB-671]
MEIITKRFILRDFVQEDEPAFLAYHAEPRYAEFCSAEESTPEFIQELFQRFRQWATEIPRRNYQLAIVDHRTLELVGCGGLRQNGYGSEQAELGIELAPQFWGRYAYAIEIGKALIDFGFRDLGLKEIIGISVSANLRVSRLAKRYGFVEIGIQPSPDWMNVRGWNQIEWQLTRESWEHLFPSPRLC